MVFKFVHVLHDAQFIDLRQYTKCSIVDHLIGSVCVFVS